MEPVEDLLLQLEDLTTCILRATLAIKIFIKTHGDDIEKELRDDLSQLIAKWFPPTKNIACQVQEQLKTNYDLNFSIKIEDGSYKVNMEVEDERDGEDFCGMEEQVGFEDTNQKQEEVMENDMDVFFDYTADDSVDVDVDPLLDHDPLDVDVDVEGHVALSQSQSSRKDMLIVRLNSEIEWIRNDGNGSREEGNVNVKRKVLDGNVEGRKTRISKSCPGYKAVKCLACDRHYGDERIMKEHCRKKHLDFCIANPDLVCPPFSKRRKNIYRKEDNVPNSIDLMRTLQTRKVAVERIDDGGDDVPVSEDNCDSVQQVVSDLDDGDIEWKDEFDDEESDKSNLSEEEWSPKTRVKLKRGDKDVDGSQNQTSSCPVCNRNYIEERYMKEHCRKKHLNFCVANPDLVCPPFSKRLSIGKRKENIMISTEIVTSRDMTLSTTKVREQMDHRDVGVDVDKCDSVQQVVSDLDGVRDIKGKNEVEESDKSNPSIDLNTRKRDKSSDNYDGPSSCPVCRKSYLNLRSMKEHCRKKHLDFCKANPDVVCPPFSRRSRSIGKRKDTVKTNTDVVTSAADVTRTLRRGKVRKEQKHHTDVDISVTEDKSDSVEQIESDLDDNVDRDIEDKNKDEESDKSNLSDEEWVPKKQAKLKLDDNDGSQKQTPICPVCQRNYRNVKYMREHCRTKHFDICKANPNIVWPPFSGTLGLRRKKPKEGKEQVGRLCCTICTKTFGSKSALDLHIRNHTAERLFSCTECGASFKTKFDRDRHYIHRHQDPSFLCDLCPKIFGWEVSLIYHKKNEHPSEGEKLERFLCTRCGAWFKTKNTLSSHTQRRYPCNLCPKRFKNNTQLNYHLKTHSNPGGRQRGLNRERDETKPVRCRWNLPESNESILKD